MLKTIRQAKKEARAQAKQDRAAFKQRRKERSLLPKEERAKLNKQDAAEMKAASAKRKAEIKAMPKADAKVAKNYDRAYWRRYNQSRRATIVWSVILIVVLVIGTPIGYILTKFSHLAAQGSGYDQNAFGAEMVKAGDLALQIEGEGLVLLKNEGNILPLTTTKVNVFGISAYSPVLSASGSAVSSGAGGNLYDALHSVNVEYNPALFAMYQNWIAGPDDGGIKSNPIYKILTTPLGTGELPYTNLTPDELSAARVYSDTAIYVISRMAGETNDISITELALTVDEQKTIELMASTFDNVIVLINTANQMELGWVNQYPSVKAVMWIGRPGQNGLVAVAQALVGQVNPSGRMADTYVYDFNSIPASVNFGDFTYNDSHGNPIINAPTPVTEYYANDGYGKFVQYKEGIYIGYRFFETYYLGDEAGYRKAVLYPFGYGLSYTSFKWELVSFDANADKVTVQVKVTNTGAVAGKDVVEVYYSAPYYPESGIEKSAVNLAAYGKTDMLAPGQSQTLTITYDTNDMASYSMQLGHYILEHGDYAVRISTDVHTPVFTETYTVASNIEITNDPVSGNKITNLFDFVNGGLTYMSRSDFDGTYPTAPTGADLNAPASVIEALTAKHAITTEGTLPTTGVNNGIMLADLKGLDYNDPLWEKFLDQFTVREMADLASNAGYQTISIDRLGMPHTIHCEGPMAIDNPFGGLFAYSWPMPGVLASTWNTQLAVDYGTINGEFAKIFGFTAWYAPAINTHRTPMEGRNGEYYSEDPVLTGTTAASQTIGAQAQGLVVTLKHFALNEQETNRNALHTWANEQSMREIYLKPWEIAIKDGGAHGVMSSYNDIGAIKTGSSHALLTDLIRTEWGFQGYVIADFVIPLVAYADYPLADFIYAGNDLMMDPIFGPFIVYDILNQYKVDPIGMGTALRNNTKHVAYMLLQTAVFEK
jgi:beta-glucosidase